MSQDFHYRPLHQDELVRIAEIDRRETIAENYVIRNGKLLLEEHVEYVNRFSPADIQSLVERQQNLLIDGGCVFGAFHENTIAGIASVEQRRRGAMRDFCKLDILYVSFPFRGYGVGKALLNRCKTIATTYGANRLYISATPTKNTVDFYLRHGARVTREIDSALFALEPEDIHLEMPLL